MMVVAEECLDSSKKRKQRAEESDLLSPLPKHFCLEQASLPDSSCPSSDIECAECSHAMEDTKTSDETSSSSSASVTGGASLYTFKDSSYSTAGSSNSSSGYARSSIDQCCSKGNDKAQEYVDELSEMEFIYPEFGVENLPELLHSQDSNLEGSYYTLSSARWSVSNQDSEETTTKPTIDQEFEDYFSTLMM
ncbi:unnamed protein product [Thlaspi arvense]|uniref:Uncharacterized protein n=1 Tax=Thlaspi arvense TaxID=13288 RepID=A0AAU9SWK5_THLAR|nr:unnamed protein product [Thlaspi arvense]